LIKYDLCPDLKIQGPFFPSLILQGKNIEKTLAVFLIPSASVGSGTTKIRVETRAIIKTEKPG
jgi:hypothetical protein